MVSAQYMADAFVARRCLKIPEENKIMKNPLDSLWGTIISGLILTVVLYVFLKNFLLPGV